MFFNRKQKELETRIQDLEYYVKLLKMNQEFPIYRAENTYGPATTLPMKKVIQIILDHLNLSFTYRSEEVKLK